MRARGRLLSCLATIVIALAGFVTAGTLPAAAAASPVQYVALGDSYAAGIGAPPYQSVPLGGKICIQSKESGYPVLLDPVLLDLKGRIDLQANATCPGATTTDVAGIVESGESGLTAETRLVALTVGGADLNFVHVLTTCTLLVVENDCKDAIANEVTPNLQKLGDNLRSLYAQIARAAPEARIVVTGYPLLFEPPDDNHHSDFSLDLVIKPVNDAGAALNKTIEDAVAAANEDGNIQYVDVTEEFKGHGVLLRVDNPADPSDDDAFIHSPFICDRLTERICQDPAAYHPNGNGYHAYADAISAALPRGWVKPLA